MAAPANITPFFKFVVLSVQSGSNLSSKTTNIQTGYVEQTGGSVTKCAVGDTVLFKAGVQFSNDPDSGDQWTTVHEDDIYLKYTVAP